MASAPSRPSAASPSVPSSLSESLLSEQSVRLALLSGSSGLPHCFLFFFLVWVKKELSQQEWLWDLHSAW